MRAARLLDLLLVLQRHGRSTAARLAREFEVSERTIRRDVEALSEAGVPIFARQGAGGGIELLDDSRTNLTGLTVDEAEALFLAGQPGVAHRLGLGAPAATVRRKLRSAVPDGLVDHVDRLETWFVHDPDPWAGHHVPHGELRRLARNIRCRCQVEVTLANEPATTVCPLGLVLKAGSWHLVHAEPDGMSVTCIDDLRVVRLTNRPFDSPPAFSLAVAWRAHVDHAAASRPG